MKNKLFTALQKLIDEKKIFLRSDITRKTVADMLQSNERYLHDAVKGNTGLAFSEYMNLLRVKYAAKLLMNNLNETVEEIAEQSGFGSKVSFYRQFGKTYGTTPDKFRKCNKGIDDFPEMKQESPKLKRLISRLISYFK